MFPRRLAAPLATAFVLVQCALTAAVAAPATPEPSVNPASRQLVAFFKSVCFDTVPDISAVEVAALTNGWQELSGEALKRFAPSNGKPKQLRAWRVEDREKVYHVSYAITPAGKDVTDKLSGFGGADAYSCSVLPQAANHEAVTGLVTALVGRKHQGEFEQARQKVRMWSGLTPQVAVFLYHFRPVTGENGGLLNVTAIPKPQ